jgi:hypothetical protein
VPRVVGQTESARQKKIGSRGELRQWDESSFFTDLSRRRGEQEAMLARRLLEWANQNGLGIWWGQGKTDGSFFPSYSNKFGQHLLFSVWTYGAVELQFQHMRRPPFCEPEKRKELADRLLAMEGVSIPETALNKRPSFKLGILTKPANLERFLAGLDWMLSEIKAVENGLEADYISHREGAKSAKGKVDE